MNQETEIRILEIQKEEWITKLEELGAIFEGDWFQKRKVYDFHPAIENKWIRLRTCLLYTSKKKIGKKDRFEKKSNISN